MKFFTKIYLLFLLVILFSSMTSAFLLFQFIQQSSRTEARSNMKEASDIISMNFESVERNMWRYLAKIENDEELHELFESGRWTHEEIIRILLSMPQPLEIDFIVLSGRGYTVLPISNIAVPYDELYDLSITRWHPNIGILRMNNGLTMSGSIKLGAVDSNIDVFLIKDLNTNFCKRLTYDTTAELLIINRGKVIEGTLDEKRILVDIPVSESEKEYREYFGVIRDSREYNAVLRKQSIVEKDRSDILFLSMYSNVPYAQRIEKFTSSIILVIILSAVLATFISLGFSRSITRPILALSSAVGRIQSGDFSVSVRPFSGLEITRLVEGFNAMAENLRQDKVAQESYIREIEFLSDYNKEIIESIGAGICIVDNDLRIEKTNREFREIFGGSLDYAGSIKVTDIDPSIISRKIIGKIEAIISGVLPAYSSGRIADEEKFFQIQLNSLSGKRCILAINDITYRAGLEDRLYQSERLSSLSVLSAGVAHEINNPLSSIMTNVQNLIFDEDDPRRLEELKWVDQETRRIARIVSDLLNFSSNSRAVSERAAIQEITEQIIRFSGYSSGKKKIDYLVDISAEGLTAEISPDEFKQIMFNLILNAEQALEGAGKIRISAERVPDFIEIRISDNGPGMDSETLARIYDPFFTTKKTSGGTGLGLSVVYGIIRKYAGEIEFDSIKGAGTTVTFRLPALQEGDEK